MPGKGDEPGPGFPPRGPGCVLGEAGGGPASGSPRPGFEFSRPPRSGDLTPVTAPEANISRGETRSRKPARRRVSAADGRAPAPPREPPTARPAPGRLLRVLRSAPWRAAPERRTKGRAGRVWCPAPSPGLPVPRRPLLPGTEALTAPAPPARGGRRPGSCCRQSAAKRRPQLGPSARALAPPIVKGPAGGSAYKASAGAHAAPPLPISSRDTAGSPRSRPIGGRAGPRCSAQRGLACFRRAPQHLELARRDPAFRVVPAPTAPTAKPARGAGRERKGAPENYGVDHSGGQSRHATHLLRTFGGSRCWQSYGAMAQLGV